jgi:FAD/FMN-containing dehydrogenase/Fe-S oxidoreductase
MILSQTPGNLNELVERLEGDLFIDDATLILYSTDASAYKEKPLAVIWPKNNHDIRIIIDFAIKHHIPVIPRAAGTSLAGQVVGNGIIVDISRYMNSILEINASARWVIVQPGVVLDELNLQLKPYGLFFAPETSTSNRCNIGGMVGNNACGAHSLLYGSTRDHLLEVKGFLSDGSEVDFKPLSATEFEDKLQGNALENKIYRNIYEILTNSVNQEQILDEYPDKELKRRNTGYAIDMLLDQQPFKKEGKPFNMSTLVAGSEGTLVFITAVKLNLLPLPPKAKGLICAHFATLEEAMEGNLIALRHKPGAIELIDKIILDCTKENISHNKNRFFIQGDPGAILVIEFARETEDEILKIREALVNELQQASLGYHFPLVLGSDMNKVWALRKAGVGLLSNVVGDAKPVPVIEDTAVNPVHLAAYIADFKAMLDKHGLSCVYHAHIATGELHLRPVLNLKDPEQVKLFRTVATETAHLVKKYKGSLSGEHGDGRLRGEFIPLMLGEHIYKLLVSVKETWDPTFLFNPGKIIRTPPMDSSLRYEPGKPTREIETIFDFSKTQGLLRLAEQCNGSGDCRKAASMGGTMCPSFMASRDEHTTTRARANILREFLTHSKKLNPFDHKEIYETLDLCLSCKGCKSECPSNVDMAKLKAEFLQHYYDANGIPLRARLIAYITVFNRLGSALPSIYNFFLRNPFFSGLLKRSIGFAVKRSIPLLGRTTLRKWARKNLRRLNDSLPANAALVHLFVDEFTNYNDSEIGIKSILLLNRLGYRVSLPAHGESGRTYISKGLIRTARKIANRNVKSLREMVNSESPLLGIEPSAILSFRDEYPELVDVSLRTDAEKLAKSAFLIDEFIAGQMDLGYIKKEQFSMETRSISLHGHCQQKAVASTDATKKMLSFPANYSVSEIPSGCCGMAGSFGYEKEHYALSMKVGELVLFPSIRKSSKETIIAAPGTSCRHQIKDGTGVHGKHPVEILYEALLPSA